MQMSPEVKAKKQEGRPGRSITPPAGATWMGANCFVESRPSVGSHPSPFTLPLASGKAGSLTLDSRQIEHQLVRQQPIILPDWEGGSPRPEGAPLILVVDDGPSQSAHTAPPAAALWLSRHPAEQRRPRCAGQAGPGASGSHPAGRDDAHPLWLRRLPSPAPAASQDNCGTAAPPPSTSYKEDRGGLQRRDLDYLVKPFCKEELFARSGPCWEASAGRASWWENHLLKQEIEHRLRLQASCIRIRSGCWPCSGKGRPHRLHDGQGMVLFASRALARLLEPEPENHGRLPGQSGWPARWQASGPDMAAHRSRI